MVSPGSSREGRGGTASPAGPGDQSGRGGAVGRPALVAMVLAALFVAIVVVVARRDVSGLDREVAEAVLGWRSEPLDWFFWLFTLLGNGMVLAALASAVVIVLVLWGAWSRALLMGAAMLAGQGLSSLLKAGIGRERPPEELMLIEPPHSASLPSGHAMLTMVFFTVLLVVLANAGRTQGETRGAWRRMPLVVGLATLVAVIGFSRIYLGVHWTTDVLAGWCVGGAWAALSCAVFALWRGSGRRPRDGHPSGRPIVRTVVAAVLGLAVVAAYLIAALTDPLS